MVAGRIGTAEGGLPFGDAGETAVGVFWGLTVIPSLHSPTPPPGTDRKLRSITQSSAVNPFSTTIIPSSSRSPVVTSRRWMTF